MARLNETTARDAKNIHAALGDALLPPLIGIVIEYRWIDVTVVWAAADDDDKHFDIYFRSCDPMLYKFAMERGIIDHIEAGIRAVGRTGSYTCWIDLVDRFHEQIAAFAKNGWYDAIDIFVDISPNDMLGLSRCLLPSIMRDPPDNKKRYAELFLAAVALGTYGGSYVDFDITRRAIAEGMASLPESYRAETAAALDEIEADIFDGDDAQSLRPLIAKFAAAAADEDD